MEAGSADALGEDGETRPDGRLHLVDGGRAPKVVSRGHSNVYLALPRALAMRAIGGDRALNRRAVTPLPDAGLSRILAAHMRAVRRQARELDTVAATAVMQSLEALSLSTLRQMRPIPPGDDEAEPGLVLATRRIIDRDAEARRLTAEVVAARLGCSRTRLFAAFQAEGLSLADCIRQARMARAKAVLEDPGRTVDEAAWISGYADASSFGKAFRRAFGASPGEWRRTRRAP